MRGCEAAPKRIPESSSYHTEIALDRQMRGTGIGVHRNPSGEKKGPILSNPIEGTVGSRIARLSTAAGEAVPALARLYGVDQLAAADVCDRTASLELGLRIPDAIHIAEPERVRHSQHWTSAWAGVASALDVAVAIIDIIFNIMFVIGHLIMAGNHRPSAN